MRRFESEQLLERYRARKKPLGVIMLEVKAGTDPEGDLIEKNSC
jgi:hypothetical protein